eukprot:scaffold17527_cov42-Cyclotella_meneghiniana.AAC.4
MEELIAEGGADAPADSADGLFSPDSNVPMINLSKKNRATPRKSREASGTGKKQVPTGGKAPSLYLSISWWY